MDVPGIVRQGRSPRFHVYNAVDSFVLSISYMMRHGYNRETLAEFRKRLSVFFGLEMTCFDQSQQMDAVVERKSLALHETGIA